jgi:hypothetical protein
VSGSPWAVSHILNFRVKGSTKATGSGRRPEVVESNAGRRGGTVTLFVARKKRALGNHPS